MDNQATVYFSLFMTIWATLFIEFWRREQNSLQFEWDAVNFNKKIEKIRPQFEMQVKETKKNPVTGNKEPFVCQSEKIKRYSLSVTITCLMISLVLACFIGVLVYQVCFLVVLSNIDSMRKVASPLVAITSGLLTVFNIAVLGQFYKYVAVKLTDMEYQRTDSQYQDSLTIKMYLFEFVNNYSYIFYIAFFKGRFAEFTNEIF